ncbi:peptidylprolyl isomerase [Dapis sp. BLCC M172]|uniref:peptidylprolyl isomerase n=1 Tax=Dapis sp. BLCC M172 TaxID=2975281 RepID=UPI003CE74830
MLESITITPEDILKQVKFSLKLSETIEGIITRKIIKIAAEDAGIEAKPEELQKAADAIRVINQLHGAKETWAWLHKHSLSIDDLEEMAYYSFLSGKLADHLFHDKIEPYFLENKLNYGGAFIYEIILDNEDLAMELFSAIQEGKKTFSEVAYQYIQEEELRRAGGYQGRVNFRELRPEVYPVVFAAKPPQLIKPIVTAYGVHLIFVEEIVQPELTDKLRCQIMSHLFNEWIKEQIEKVEVIKKCSSTLTSLVNINISEPQLYN